MSSKLKIFRRCTLNCALCKWPGWRFTINPFYFAVTGYFASFVWKLILKQLQSVKFALMFYVTVFSDQLTWFCGSCLWTVTETRLGFQSKLKIKHLLLKIVKISWRPHVSKMHSSNRFSHVEVILAFVNLWKYVFLVNITSQSP